MPPTTVRIPAWADPNNASVLDNWWTRTARTLGGFLGAADPTSQAMAIGAPVELPGGAGGPGQRLMGKTLKAFHGSPHDFDQFSLAKVGTGEGGQAYGHGLYFAENPEVAKSYKEALGSDVKVRGMKINTLLNTPDFPLRPIDKTALQTIQLTNGENTLPYVEQLIQQGKQPPELKEVAASWLKDVDSVRGGKTYEVNLHASPDELLDWDKPLSQQSSKVQAATRPFLKETNQGWWDRNSDKFLGKDPTGEQLYKAAENHREMMFQKTGLVPASKEGATDLFAKSGIKGIQYLDQGSRVAGDAADFIAAHGSKEEALKEVQRQWTQARSAHGYSPVDESRFKSLIADINKPQTKNFVIFDDKIIEIAKKYGISLPVAASLYKWQQSQKGQ